MFQREPGEGFYQLQRFYLGGKEAMFWLSHWFQLVSFFNLGITLALLPASLYVIQGSAGETTQDLKPDGLVGISALTPANCVAVGQ